MSDSHSSDLQFVADLVDECQTHQRRAVGRVAETPGMRAAIERAVLRAWKRGRGEDQQPSRAAPDRPPSQRRTPIESPRGVVAEVVAPGAVLDLDKRRRRPRGKP